MSNTKCYKLHKIYDYMVNNLVQYVIVRKDLIKLPPWNIGSIIAQACHASSAALLTYVKDPNVLEYSNDIDNMRKVVLECSNNIYMDLTQIKDEAELKLLSELLTQNKIDHKIWIEQPENFATALATKPYNCDMIKKYFAGLRLLKNLV